MGFYTLAGSHCSNHNYWSSYAASRGGSSRTTIVIHNNNGRCHESYSDSIWGNKCPHDGKNGKAAAVRAAVGFGFWLLASQLGGKILSGIGTGFKYTGRTLWEGGKALVNTFCYAGKGILNGIRKIFGKEPIENKWETFEMKNPFRSD